MHDDIAHDRQRRHTYIHTYIHAYMQADAAQDRQRLRDEADAKIADLHQQAEQTDSETAQLKVSRYTNPLHKSRQTQKPPN